jgi:hypothetical protein
VSGTGYFQGPKNRHFRPENRPIFKVLKKGPILVVLKIGDFWWSLKNAIFKDRHFDSTRQNRHFRHICILGVFAIYVFFAIC